MEKDRYISASEIGLYSFCPRAWALRQLEYEADNQWELEKGEDYHRSAGAREILKENENKPIRKRYAFIIHLLTILIIAAALCLVSILVRLVLK